jgi:hypothetical protein
LLSTAFADNLTGQASIIDGDTLEIHGTRIRLWGIDAPESNQLCRGDDSIQYRCGAKAANDLDSFLNKRPIDCVSVSLGQYRRTVAVCSIDGVDLAEWLVRNGLALDGRHTQRASTIRPNVMPIMPGEGCGRAATLSRGCFALASGKPGSRVTVRTMRTRALKSPPPDVSFGALIGLSASLN